MKSKTEQPCTDNIFSGHTVGAVIVCAGRGKRTGLTYNKILYNLGHKTVIETTLDKFMQAHIDKTVLVIAPDDEPSINNIIKDYQNVSACYGGKTRAESVFNGLKALVGCDIAVIHDGARPFVDANTIDESIASAIRFGSGIVAVPAVDTIKEVSGDRIVRSIPRSGLYNMQTPQTFRYDEILSAYNSVSGQFTDDAEIYEKAGFSPRIVSGSYDNIKITTQNDLLRTLPSSMRIGIGFDVHRLVDDRPLILGGVRIDYPKGLYGHSDADVLTHAIMDAILSAADLPDIGVLFPDTADEFENISSMVLLDRALELAKSKGLEINNISCVIIAQKPRLAGIIPSIRKSLAERLGIETNRINISATTTENLGVVADGNAIASSASCLLVSKNDNDKQ